MSKTRAATVGGAWVCLLIACGGASFETTEPNDGTPPDAGGRKDGGDGGVGRMDADTDSAPDASPDARPLDASPDSGVIDAGISTACSGNGTCELVPASCCSSCTTPRATDFVAIPRDQDQAWQATHCIGDIGCPACVPPPTNPFDDPFDAICTSGQCVVDDIRLDPFTACLRDADCVIRAHGCCDCGATKFMAIAVGQLPAYRAAVCPPDAVCGSCVSVPPVGYVAVCDGQTNHCMAKVR
jgi:hypothetical protein